MGKKITCHILVISLLPGCTFYNNGAMRNAQELKEVSPVQYAIVIVFLLTFVATAITALALAANGKGMEEQGGPLLMGLFAALVLLILCA